MMGQKVEYDGNGPFPSAGSYWKQDGRWYCVVPNGECGNLGNHSVVEHEDGTITVSPSILISMDVEGERKELFHGYLERGIWRSC